jgi:hypothetical protein
MSSRSTLILALVLSATSNTSVYARPKHPHPNLRAGKISFEPDKKLAKDAALEVVEIPSWKDIEVPVSLSHRDEN